MSNLQKYYHEIIKQITEYLKTEQFDSAKEMAEQELASPYIPLEFIQPLEKLFIQAKQASDAAWFHKQFEGLNQLQMLGQVYDKKKGQINMVALHVFLQKFAKDIDDVSLGIFSQIFADANIANEHKIDILQLLKEHNIKHQIRFFNNQLKKNVDISSTDDFEMHHNPFFQKLTLQLQDKLMQNPSQLTLGLEIAKLFYFYHFGSQVPITNEALANSILKYLDFLFQDQKITDPNFALIEQVFTIKK